MPRSILVVPMALCLLALPGCLVHSGSNTKYSGNYVASEDVAKITPGKTTEAEVRTMLGVPSGTNDMNGGKELRWSYTKRECSSSAVFLLFSSHDSTETKHTIVVGVKDGLVTDVRTE